MFIANYFLFFFTYFAKASKRPLASPDLPPIPSANRSDKPPEKKPKPGPGEKVTLDSYYYANMDGQGEVRATKKSNWIESARKTTYKKWETTKIYLAIG